MVAQPTGLWVAVEIERGEGAGGQKVRRDNGCLHNFCQQKGAESKGGKKDCVFNMGSCIRRDLTLEGYKSCIGNWKSGYRLRAWLLLESSLFTFCGRGGELAACKRQLDCCAQTLWKDETCQYSEWTCWLGFPISEASADGALVPGEVWAAHVRPL